MAFARIAFRTLFILLILFAAIGLMLPSSTTVERSIVIDAPPAKVFDQLNGMRAFHAWSPWSQIDPQTVYEFSGPDQGVGSRMNWYSGNEQVGQGSQEITLSVPAQKVVTALQFGDKGSGVATFLLDPEGGATRVRWQFSTEFGWDLFGRYVGLLLDNMIGSQYDRGLKDLKARIENKPGASS
ncbi:MAG: SRPBCC family protein [Gammaproteobacteria bacterium]|nr:SRPBCC family protein [Gammaproteobacteria bacterium]